jgi:S-adenosylmethionine decarboxylase
MDYVDLAPDIYRQRMVIEGIPSCPIDSDHIKRYLSELSDACGRKTLIIPVTRKGDAYGWAGRIYREATGAHSYA